PPQLITTDCPFFRVKASLPIWFPSWSLCVPYRATSWLKKLMNPWRHRKSTQTCRIGQVRSQKNLRCLNLFLDPLANNLTQQRSLRITVDRQAVFVVAHVPGLGVKGFE